MLMEQCCRSYGCTVIKIKSMSDKINRERIQQSEETRNRIELSKTGYTVKKVLWVRKTENRKTPVLKNNCLCINNELLR